MADNIPFASGGDSFVDKNNYSTPADCNKLQWNYIVFNPPSREKSKIRIFTTLH